MTTFEEIFDETGVAKAHGLASLLTKYNTVACIYMLSDVLHTVAKLQGSLQGKEVDLASVPGMVERTLERLKETQIPLHGLKTIVLCSLILHNLEKRVSLSQKP